MNSLRLSRNARLGMVKTLSAVFPDYFGALGARQFVRPRQRPQPRHWHQAFDGFERLTESLGEQQIPLWTRGQGPVVLLVHGWETDHYAMGGFVQPLLDAGYQVAALDLPAHGLASGREGPLPLLAQAISRIGQRLGPLHAVIAHSVGGASSALALQAYSLEASRLVLIGAPHAVRYQAQAQARMQGLSQRAIKRMEQHMQQVLGAPLEQFEVPRALAGLKQTAVMLVHAKDDPVVPITAAQANAASCSAKTLWLENGGHNRPLGDQMVIRAVMSFLKTSPRRNRYPAGLRYHAGQLHERQESLTRLSEQG